MANIKKLRFLTARGNPLDGAIIASGATLDIPEPWASRFIEDKTAVEVKADKAETPKAKAEPKGKGK